MFRFVCDQGTCGAKEYNPPVRFHEVGYARSGGAATSTSSRTCSGRILGEGGRRPMLALILVEHLDGRRAVFHPLRRDYCWLLIGDGSLGGKDDPCKTIP